MSPPMRTPTPAVAPCLTRCPNVYTVTVNVIDAASHTLNTTTAILNGCVSVTRRSSSEGERSS